MSAEQQAVSFNPDDASGLIDNIDALIKKVEVDYWKSERSDFRGVYVIATYAPAGGAEFTERYLLGKDSEWAPNGPKTGALPVQAGGRIWNKSEAYKWVTSLVNAGFPKGQVGADLSVFTGANVHVNRVADGSTYKDKEGKERARTTLLVTKVNELPKGKGAAAKTTTAAASTATTGQPAEVDDKQLADFLKESIEDPKNKGVVPIAKLKQEIFLRATRAKVAPAVRTAMQNRVVDEGFLTGLAEAGTIGFDGTQVSAAA